MIEVPLRIAGEVLGLDYPFRHLNREQHRGSQNAGVLDVHQDAPRFSSCNASFRALSKPNCIRSTPKIKWISLIRERSSHTGQSELFADVDHRYWFGTVICGLPAA